MGILLIKNILIKVLIFICIIIKKFFLIIFITTEPMVITKKEAKTISYYNDNAKKWVQNHGPNSKPSFWLEELNQFQEYLTQGHILEIGVGGAGEAAEFIKKGYTFTGIDPAQNLIEIAQKQFPKATFLVNNMYDFESPKNTFDGFWCSAVLLHVSKEKIDLGLQKIYAAMKPDAIGFISLAEGNGEYFDNETGRYFYLYGQDEFANILKRNSFIIQKQDIRKQDTRRAWLQSWLTFFVKVKK